MLQFYHINISSMQKVLGCGHVFRIIQSIGRTYTVIVKPLQALIINIFNSAFTFLLDIVILSRTKSSGTLQTGYELGVIDIPSKQ